MATTATTIRFPGLFMRSLRGRLTSQLLGCDRRLLCAQATAAAGRHGHRRKPRGAPTDDARYFDRSSQNRQAAIVAVGRRTIVARPTNQNDPGILWRPRQPRAA